MAKVLEEMTVRGLINALKENEYSRTIHVGNPPHPSREEELGRVRSEEAEIWKCLERKLGALLDQ